MTDLLDVREISEIPDIIDAIPHHIGNAEPGDEDLLTEIQGIESLQKPLFDDLVTPGLEVAVVHWLLVSSQSFLAVKQWIIPD